MKADVLITFNGPKNICEVALVGATPKPLPCTQVVSYLVNDLKLPKGALFDVKTIPDVNVSEYESVMAALKTAGYNLTPGIYVGFLTEPKGA